MAQPPLWRRLYDTAERAVAPRLESVVRTEHFARGAALAAWAQAAARAQAEALSARVWHVANLPASTDIALLRAQIGALDREVRRLALHLEQQARGDARTDGRETDGAGAQPP
ncbi:MAG TPA: hypothetical protein VMI33_12350 [Streptosporangiaceae bacterium]|nr:hypothetical protein [Streptosporangiaceae bacterium]